MSPLFFISDVKTAEFREQVRVKSSLRKGKLVRGYTRDKGDNRNRNRALMIGAGLLGAGAIGAGTMLLTRGKTRPAGKILKEATQKLEETSKGMDDLTKKIGADIERLNNGITPPKGETQRKIEDLNNQLNESLKQAKKNRSTRTPKKVNIPAEDVYPAALPAAKPVSESGSLSASEYLDSLIKGGMKPEDAIKQLKAERANLFRKDSKGRDFIPGPEGVKLRKALLAGNSYGGREPAFDLVRRLRLDANAKIQAKPKGKARISGLRSRRKSAGRRTGRTADALRKKDLYLSDRSMLAEFKRRKGAKDKVKRKRRSIAAANRKRLERAYSNNPYYGTKTDRDLRRAEIGTSSVRNVGSGIRALSNASSEVRGWIRLVRGG